MKKLILFMLVFLTGAVCVSAGEYMGKLCTTSIQCRDIFRPNAVCIEGKCYTSPTEYDSESMICQYWQETLGLCDDDDFDSDFDNDGIWNGADPDIDGDGIRNEIDDTVNNPITGQEVTSDEVTNIGGDYSKYWEEAEDRKIMEEYNRLKEQQKTNPEIIDPEPKSYFMPIFLSILSLVGIGLILKKLGWLPF